jgi:hypothetical protein
MDKLHVLAGCCFRLRIRSIAADHPCPPRALHGEHQWSLTANHGQLKPLLSGSIMSTSSCSQAHDQLHAPPAGLSSGMAKGWTLVLGDKLRRYPVASAPAA